jgi:hypothetical protein
MRGAVMLALRDGFMHDSPLENMCGFFIAGRYHNRTPFLAGHSLKADHIYLQHRRDVARKQLLYLTLKFVGVRICLSDTGYCLCPIDQETMIFIVVLVVGIFDRGYVLEEFSFLFWG